MTRRLGIKSKYRYKSFDKVNFEVKGRNRLMFIHNPLKVFFLYTEMEILPFHCDIK